MERLWASVVDMQMGELGWRSREHNSAKQTFAKAEPLEGNESRVSSTNKRRDPRACIVSGVFQNARDSSKAHPPSRNDLSVVLVFPWLLG